MDDAIDIQRIVDWVLQHGFERIAVQLPDSLLAGAATCVVELQKRLPRRKVFLLGDSAYGSSSVDEVGAEHYGADCIVHVGSSDQEHAGAMPVLFIFSQVAAEQMPTKAVVNALEAHLRQTQGCLVLLCEVTWQWVLERFTQELQDAFRGLEVLLAEPQQEALASRKPAGIRRHDWRFGTASLGAWWSALGPLAMAAAARPEPLRICGRTVRNVADRSFLRQLPPNSTVLYIGDADSALERRLLLRHGYALPIWRVSPMSREVAKITSDALLMRRYRFVELARSAGAVGLLQCATGASYGQPLADRLEALLRRAGRRVYRFVVGRVTPEKLGNFPDIECFVSLASPDHFPFDTREFQVPIVSPYELEIALGAREWTGSYITDLEELLASPLAPLPPDEEDRVVQTLGAGARLRTFNSGAPGGSSTAEAGGKELPSMGPAFHSVGGERWAPARATPGLHGVAGRYSNEGGEG